MNRSETLMDGFARNFGGVPQLITRAPGRVNLIGEHTDYNDGFVLPMAIDYDVRIACRARRDSDVNLAALDLGRRDGFDLRYIDRVSGPRSWSNYVRGIAGILQDDGFPLRGMDAAVSGNVPIGAGLSSSAALELAALTAFRILNGLEIDPVRTALLCQRAENDFVGMRCGIMDQFISAMGKEGCALLIDCRSLTYEPVPLPGGAGIVVTDSGVSRGLVDSAYNERRGQCEAGAELLGVPALRDINLETFEAGRQRLPEIVERRCRHVVTENQRTLDSVEALKRGRLSEFGALMNASHASMRDRFEITTPEIDALVEIQQNTEGCLGARMTGGGFGGCTVALVEKKSVPALLDAIAARYPARSGKIPKIYICRAAQGAGEVIP